MEAGEFFSRTTLRIWNVIRRRATRLFIAFELVTGTYFLLFGIGSLIWMELPGGMLSALIGSAALLLLIIWLFRRGTKHYRVWAMLAVLYGLCRATLPCWFHFPTPGLRERLLPGARVGCPNEKYSGRRISVLCPIPSIW